MGCVVAVRWGEVVVVGSLNSLLGILLTDTKIL